MVTQNLENIYFSGRELFNRKKCNEKQITRTQKNIYLEMESWVVTHRKIQCC
jgi:hypothetical protein